MKRVCDGKYLCKIVEQWTERNGQKYVATDHLTKSCVPCHLELLHGKAYVIIC